MVATTMAESDAMPGVAQRSCHALGRLLQRHVDDSRSCRLVAQDRKQRAIPFTGADHGGTQGQVGPVERRAYRVVGLDVEAGADIVKHLRRRRGGECQHALGVVQLRVTGQLQVIGSEVVPPLRDAVRFVDGEQADGYAVYGLAKALVVEPFRRHVEQPHRPGAYTIHHLAILLQAQARIEPGGADAAGVQRVDLVLHQRDQRRHDQCEPWQQQRRQLVAQRLAAPCAKHRSGRVARQQVFDGLLLAGTELVEAEVLLQGGTGVGHSSA